MNSGPNLLLWRIHFQHLICGNTKNMTHYHFRSCISFEVSWISPQCQNKELVANLTVGTQVCTECQPRAQIPHAHKRQDYTALPRINKSSPCLRKPREGWTVICPWHYHMGWSCKYDTTPAPPSIDFPWYQGWVEYFWFEYEYEYEYRDYLPINYYDLTSDISEVTFEIWIFGVVTSNAGQHQNFEYESPFQIYILSLTRFKHVSFSKR